MPKLLVDIANELARELPVGWTVQICIENGAGWVELINSEGEQVPIERFDGPEMLDRECNQALRIAKGEDPDADS